MTITLTDSNLAKGETYGVTIGSLYKTDKNGSRYYYGTCSCDRCGGTGVYTYYTYMGQTHGTCFKCGGTRNVSVNVKVMTDEYSEKLFNKKMAKAQKEQEYAQNHRAEIAHAAAMELYNEVTKCIEKHCDCSKCIRRDWCSCIAYFKTKVNEALEVGAEFSEEVINLYNVDTESTVWEKVTIVTLDGEPCHEGRWFDDKFGGSKRCITKPDGEKVWTSARTDRGLKKFGLRTYDFEVEGALTK